MNQAAQKSASTVLIVEDEVLILSLARMEFEDAGFEVATASDSGSALAMIESDAVIDLLFTDIRMPGPCDGWALAQRARQVRQGLRVIYATGFSADTPQLVEGGVLVIKPYMLEKIIEVARELSTSR